MAAGIKTPKRFVDEIAQSIHQLWENNQYSEGNKEASRRKHMTGIEREQRA